MNVRFRTERPFAGLRGWAQHRAILAVANCPVLGDIDISRLATEEQVTAAYVTRVVRLAFLAPTVVEAVLAGRAAARVDGAALVATGVVATSWREQVRLLLPAPSARMQVQ